MFKFFRKYQTYILGVGVSLLMVVFLIEGAMPSLRGGGGGVDLSGEPIGKIAGQTITNGQYEAARFDLHVLGRLSTMFLMTVGQDDDAARAWMLMLHDAKSIGIAASEQDASLVLQAAGLSDDNAVTKAARSLEVTVPALRESAKHFAIVRQYKALALGVQLEPLPKWAEKFLSVASIINDPSAAGLDPQIRYFFLQRAAIELASSELRSRLSRPVAERFVSDQQASVKVTMLAIPAVSRAEKAPEPDAAALQALFDKYKNRLPGDTAGLGEDEPHLGYRFPDRVKLEYLAIGAEVLKKKVRIDEAEAIKFYNDHKMDFANAADPAGSQPSTRPAIKSYEEVRQMILTELKDQKAAELGERMVKAAAAMLTNDMRSLKEDNGYRDVPSAWSPMPLSAVATKLQEQFGVLPEVVRLEDRWLDRSALASLPGIGQGIVPVGGTRRVGLVDYVMSARELKPKSDDPLVSLHLQAKVPSQPLLNYMDGTRYLFRLTAVEAARSPEKLDEVREQVTADARKVAAFKALESEKTALLAKFNTTDIDKLASEVKGRVFTPSEFKRRTMGPRGGMSVPAVEDVGESKTFVDAVMDVAELNGGGAPTTRPSAGKTLAVAVPAKLTLYLVRIDSFTPMRRDELENATSNPLIAAGLYDRLMGASLQNPFSYDALAKRLNYAPLHDRKDEKNGGKKGDEPASSL